MDDQRGARSCTQVFALLSDCCGARRRGLCMRSGTLYSSLSGLLEFNELILWSVSWQEVVDRLEYRPLSARKALNFHSPLRWRLGDSARSPRVWAKPDCAADWKIKRPGS